jgi:hypothetical protein
LLLDGTLRIVVEVAVVVVVVVVVADVPTTSCLTSSQPSLSPSQLEALPWQKTPLRSAVLLEPFTRAFSAAFSKQRLGRT